MALTCCEGLRTQGMTVPSYAWGTPAPLGREESVEVFEGSPMRSRDWERARRARGVQRSWGSLGPMGHWPASFGASKSPGGASASVLLHGRRMEGRRAEGLVSVRPSGLSCHKCDRYLGRCLGSGKVGSLLHIPATFGALESSPFVRRGLPDQSVPLCTHAHLHVSHTQLTTCAHALITHRHHSSIVTHTHSETHTIHTARRRVLWEG